MSKIKILSENLANKIAAGEVVQRPESVVKELIENSIDAGSTSIEVIIKNAGKSLIQVIDNGEGMSEEDAILCIQKHATSKISSEKDLDAIKTLGFRGEALSSIAAVSQLEIKTERYENEIGTLIRLESQENIHTEKGSFQKGTSISVKNLFYNTPARRNFLKTDATELKHIIDTFNKLALSYPDINFKFYLDGNLTFDYKNGSLEDRIKNVFSEKVLNSIIPVEQNTDYISMYGYVGKPSLLKKIKGDQYVYLNSRYVISKQINHAVYSAYENVLEKGDYPFFILFLKIEPQKIDVNVHPSKLEVRFDDEKDIYNFVLSVVRKSLAQFDLVPSLVFSEDKFFQNNLDNQINTEKLSISSFRKIEKDDFSDRPIQSQKAKIDLDFSNKDIDKIFNDLNNIIDTSTITDETPLPFDKADLSQNQSIIQKTITLKPSTEASNSPFMIQLHNKYILTQVKTGLMIIDQHAAHERVLYEKAISLFDADLPFSQQLLFPKNLDLDPGSYEILKVIYSYLQKLGFNIKFFNQNKILISGVPQEIIAGEEEKILLDIIDEYKMNEREKELDRRDNVAKSFSCKAAIKTGDILSENEIRLLIDQLFATSMPYVCPHGRPIVLKISLEEFDRRFGRT
ncbi:MAG: DNA mismatch repair endonuclease MutL [Ignavibacterium sp.]